MEHYLYRFNETVPGKEMEETFLLALLAVDRKQRVCIIESGSVV